SVCSVAGGFCPIPVLREGPALLRHGDLPGVLLPEGRLAGGRGEDRGPAYPGETAWICGLEVESEAGEDPQRAGGGGRAGIRICRQPLYRPDAGRAAGSRILRKHGRSV